MNELFDALCPGNHGLFDIAIGMEPEDGVMAFTDVGVESLRQIISNRRQRT